MNNITFLSAVTSNHSTYFLHEFFWWIIQELRVTTLDTMFHFVIESEEAYEKTTWDLQLFMWDWAIKWIKISTWVKTIHLDTVWSCSKTISIKLLLLTTSFRIAASNNLTVILVLKSIFVVIVIRLFFFSHLFS